MKFIKFLRGLKVLLFLKDMQKIQIMLPKLRKMSTFFLVCKFKFQFDFRPKTQQV